VLFVLNIQLVGEDILDVAFAIRTSQGIALRLLVNVIITSSSTLEPKSTIGSAIGSTFRRGSGHLKSKEVFVVELYIY
jgi:hypothetical protein